MKHSLQFYITKHLNNLLMNYYVANRDIKIIREKLASLVRLAPKDPRQSKITPFSNPQFTGYWIEPKIGQADRTFLYFHGGGYVFATPVISRIFLSSLCNQANIRAFYLDYPLAPEHPFPFALEAAYNAYTWLLSQGTDPKKIIIGGDSAGGGLALALLLYLKQKGVPLPDRAVCISPYVDLSPEAVFPEEKLKHDVVLRKLIQLDILREAYAPKQDLHNPLISPLFGDFTGAPPILLLAASEDSLIKQDLELAKRLQEQGVQLKLVIGEGMFHDWPVILPRNAPEFKVALTDIVKFINF